jgi:hypothetical protein
MSRLPSAPTLFTIHTEEILSEWNTDNVREIQLTRNREIKTLLLQMNR